jgi:hypothetical protein
LRPFRGFGKAACGPHDGIQRELCEPVFYQCDGRIGFVDLEDGNVGRILPQSVGSGPDYPRAVVAFLPFLYPAQLTQRVYASVIAHPPTIVRIADAMQRGQHEAAAHEQSRSERSFGADLDEVDEWLVVRCDDDHGMRSLSTAPKSGAHVPGFGFTGAGPLESLMRPFEGRHRCRFRGLV